LGWVVENVALIFADLPIFGVPYFAKAADGFGSPDHGHGPDERANISRSGKPRD